MESGGLALTYFTFTYNFLIPRGIVWVTEKTSLNKLQINKITWMHAATKDMDIHETQFM
jgi:hypothetical protein